MQACVSERKYTAPVPALPDVPNVIRIRLLYTIAGKIQQGQRMFFKWSGTTPTVAMLTTLGNDVVTAFSGAGRPQSVMSAANELTNVVLEDLTTPSSAVAAVNAAVSGSDVNPILSAAACVVEELQISRRYRGGHPKTFWPLGTSSDLANEQEWTTTAVTSFATAISAFTNSIVGTTISGTSITEQDNVSYYKGFTVITNPVTGRSRNLPTLRGAPILDTVEGIAVSSRVGSQRRRRIKL